MQSSRVAVRQSCRANNAYNAASALKTAFSTSARLRQEGGELEYRSFKPNPQLKHRGLKVGPVDADQGSFASYEALSQQFDRPAAKGEGQARAEGRQQISRNPLLARQELVDDAVRKPLRQHARESRARQTLGESEGERPESPGATSGTAPPAQNGQQRGNPVSSLQRRKKLPRNRKVALAEGEIVSFKPGHWKANNQWIAQTVNQWSRAQKGGESLDITDYMRRRLDYQRFAWKPAASPAKTPTPVPWAIDPTQRQDMSAVEQLEEEITRFAAYMQPTPAEKAARQAVIAETRALVQDTLTVKDTQTAVFGSETTGLALATSDIDIRVYDGGKPHANEQARYQFGKVVSWLERRMNESPDWICVVFRHSRFPIISAQHRATGLDVQIVCSPPTTRQQQFTRQYLDQLPHLRALYFLIRTALGMRGLVDVFNGGIGSYGLLMMLTAALQRRSTSPPITASEQLRHFLAFYTHFDATKHGLTLSPTTGIAKPFLKHPQPQDDTHLNLKSYIEAARRRHDPVRAGQWAISQTRALQPYLLCLQDPANPVNDLGRKTNAIKHIQAVVRWVGERLEKNLKDAQWSHEHGVRWKEESLVTTMVGRCHEVYAERRGKVEKYGLGVLEGRAEQGAGVGDASSGKQRLEVEESVAEAEAEAVMGKGV